MTWIYIPDSTSSTVSADTADSPSDSDSPTRTPTSGRSPISSGTSTASKSSRPGSKTATSMTLPSGTTSKVLTDDPGVGPWIFSVLASRVNLTQMRASAGAPQMIEIFFPTPSESLGRWDQDSSSWRTSQASLWEVMDGHHMGAPWSESWPRSGMTRSGELYPLPTRVPHTSETGGGLWHIPTPTSADVYTANMESSQQSDDSMHSVSLPDFVGRFPTPSTMDHIDRKQMRPSRAATNRKTGYLSEMIGNWPTPTPWEQQESIENWTERRERERAKGRNGNGFGIPLDMAARLWATPTINDSKNNGSASQQERRGSDLNVQVKQMLPTPSSAYAVGSSGGSRGADLRNAVDGSLSPDWVSWLMGLPVGWTSLEPLPREEYDEWFHAQQDGTWWQEERGLPRVATGIKDRVNRLKCLGNGIVPASLALFLVDKGRE